MARSAQHPSWQPILWLIAGLTIGYIGVLLRTGQPVIAQGVACPAAHACPHGDCDLAPATS